jgi:hypothetical protein
MDHECIIPGEKDEKRLAAQKKLAAQRELLLKKRRKKEEKTEKGRVALSGYRGDFGTAGGDDWKVCDFHSNKSMTHISFHVSLAQLCTVC